MPASLIGAAFRSSKPNECYLFVKERYVILDYYTLRKDLISGPVEIDAGFPMFSKTIFKRGIDSSFETEGNVAYFFSKSQCVKTDYAPRSGPAAARIVIGPIEIVEMFPSLVTTPFANGIDAALRFPGSKDAVLFKGNMCGILDFKYNHVYEVENITYHYPTFVDTVFEEGIDAAFCAHGGNEIFIFKGEHCARVNLFGQFIGGIKRIDADWPTLRGII
ncbi:putative Hemopexin-like domain-containing protein [Medicago truncatula]|uniref:Albumin-2 protein n=2 Tax=Medicago truncatula TaxID=3880 RepID=A0A072TEU7_MEDTR|nr:albumin-2 [Medicago truncatula]XP_039690863.1 albumin-2-like [Medicago truncatula]KEH15563.1 albumin-2 protein [Medicago truncatula]RHN51479.1 putative Hemopexin-like domain-containing protein [Medicago truncatula]